jgi:hypothetical protein
MTDDILKTFTDKEFRILAALEILEDEMWVNGMIMELDGNPKTVNGDSWGKSVDDITTIWKGYFDLAINHPCWTNGRHEGDCTKVPSTCFRCMCEERLHKVRSVAKNYEKMTG